MTPQTATREPDLPTRRSGFDPDRHRHAVIVGSGRSGTNLALDLVDCHPFTICRNEPNELGRSSFARLPDGLFEESLPPDFQPAWRAALAQSPWRRGWRDRARRWHKRYYITGGLPLCEGALASARARHLAYRLFPAMRSGEWSVRRWHRAGVPILPVVKILNQPHWVVRSHPEDREQRVIHVVRAPKGFITSWRNRWVTLAPGGAEAVYEASLSSVTQILARLGRERIGPPGFSEAALVETELWRWRYVNEVVHVALGGSARYLMVDYETMRARPAEMATELGNFLGVPFDAESEARAAANSNTLFATPHAQTVDRSMLDELTDAVLSDSPLRHVLAT